MSETSKQIIELVERFDRNIESYQNQAYNETNYVVSSLIHYSRPLAGMFQIRPAMPRLIKMLFMRTLSRSAALPRPWTTVLGSAASESFL